MFRIHGSIGEEIIFGHKGDVTIPKLGGDFADIDEIIEELSTTLIKPTRDILNKNPSFFNNIVPNEFLEVYSYGFSYGEVDLPYIKEICKQLSDKAVWYFQSYPFIKEPENYEKWCGILKNFGFRGSFECFECNE